MSDWNNIYKGYQPGIPDKYGQYYALRYPENQKINVFPAFKVNDASENRPFCFC